MTHLLMQLAIDKAWRYQGLTYPNPAVGAVVTYRDKIVAVEAHQRAGTSHAEVLALLSAYEQISGQMIDFDRFDAHKSHMFLSNLPNEFFKEASIFVTLEPCNHSGKTPSCAILLEKLQLKKVTIALRDPIDGHSGGIERLISAGITGDGGLLEERARELIEPFLIWQSRAFVLFKLAQTTNGKIGGGYLSSQESLTHVHKLRAVCDELLIGGNTVRVDRPTLDCRFVDEKAPNVTIYSKNGDFDRDISLFGVPDREVVVTDDLAILDRPSFVLVEGGEGMMRAMQDRIDWSLIYQTPKLSSNSLSYDVDVELTFLHVDKRSRDIMLWSKVSKIGDFTKES
ncbi:Diaminohydroxyphosphoribosylaminopyrimidine deaminase / 5-amino-6-(5-phosphoribosylamino)uracil reductase [hydrothermal vent metagenome]|uniref:5-amino-6-(5-phosphoribosylamino)uracil reductase n=1 Tax=hydrothermal vent metagenome TaxID=652676 RepID=A0A1W1BCL3_9ZZZZ